MPSGPVLTGGASGATLRHGVAKFGTGAIGERVGAQAAWLEAHQDIPCLPRLAVSWTHGYVMEPLEPIDWSTVDWEAHFAEAIRLLGLIWCRPAETSLDLDAHLKFVQQRARLLPGSWAPLEAWCLELDWPEPVLIHGDPTLSNQVRRQSDLVFLDPNPGSPVSPSVRAQDIAHLAQSLHGYEAIKTGAACPKLPVDALKDIADLSDGEWAVVRYLTAVKFVRILTYEPKGSPFASLASELIAAR